MFTIWGAKQRFCDGMQRRDFLKIGAFGAGLTLAEMLRVKATAGGARTGSNKAAIMIYLPGGPSHMDMYDLKPNAPAEFRGEFKPIDTNVAGVQICEHMPLQAKMFVVFAGRQFSYILGDLAAKATVEGYARSVGVPDSQLDWEG